MGSNPINQKYSGWIFLCHGFSILLNCWQDFVFMYQYLGAFSHETTLFIEIKFYIFFIDFFLMTQGYGQ